MGALIDSCITQFYQNRIQFFLFFLLILFIFEISPRNKLEAKSHDDNRLIPYFRDVIGLDDSELEPTRRGGTHLRPQQSRKGCWIANRWRKRPCARIKQFCHDHLPCCSTDHECREAYHIPGTFHQNGKQCVPYIHAWRTKPNTIFNGNGNG